MGKTPLENGSVLDGRYRILSVRRESGEGILYDAVSMLTKKNMEIKEFFPENAARSDGGVVCAPDGKEAELFEMQKERFLKAARILKDFRNLPGLIRILDYFKDNGTACCVMERTEDVPLSAKVSAAKEGKLGQEQVFRGILPVLKSLQEIHESGFLYRTLRPDSIGVSENGEFRICDFGIPKEFETGGKSSQGNKEDNIGSDSRNEKENHGGCGNERQSPAIITKLSVMEGDAFTPPERMDPDGKEGPWSDLFSVTAVLYYCVTGREPEGAFERILGESLTLPSEMDLYIEPELERILAKGLAIRTDDRYQSAKEMMEDIEKIYPLKASGTSKKRWKRIVLPAAAVLGAFLCLSGIYLYFHPGMIKFHGAETETIWFEPSADADDKILEEDLRIIEARVKVFAKDGGYIWRRRGKNVCVILPASLFDEPGSRSMIGYYLLDPWELKNAGSEKTKVKLSDAEIVSGSMPGYQEYWEYENQYRNVDATGRDSDTFSNYFVRVKTTAGERKKLEEGLENFRQSEKSHTSDEKESPGVKLYDSKTTWILKDYPDSYGAKTSQYAFEQEYDGTDWNTVAVHLNEKTESLDISGPMQSEPFARLLAYNITHKGPVNKFTVDAGQKIRWEDPKYTGHGGKYQKDGKTQIRNPVYLYYLPESVSNADNRGTGKWYQILSDTKDMLDVLETPYTIGVSKDRSREIVVRIDRTKIPAFYAKGMLSRLSPTVASGWSEINERVENVEAYGHGRSSGLCVTIGGAETDSIVEDLESEVRLAKKAGNQTLKLMIRGTLAMEGRIRDQNDLNKGRLYFDDMHLAGVKTEEFDLIGRCMNKLANSGTGIGNTFELIGIQNVDGSGIPLERQRGLSFGEEGDLSEKERKELEKTADRYHMSVNIGDVGSFSQSISFSNSTYIENFEISESWRITEDAFLKTSVKTIEDILKEVFGNSWIRDGFWSSISVDLYDPKGQYRVYAALEPEDEIVFDYDIRKSTDETVEISKKRQSKFGRLAVHGIIHEYRDGSGIYSRTSRSLDHAAAEQEIFPAAPLVKKAVDSGSFFKKYGGSDTWEYEIVRG